MQLSVRRFSAQDHAILAKWWTDWKFPVMPLELLPQFGVIISEGKIDICAGFCYRTDSAYAIAELFVRNKDYRNKEIISAAFKSLFKEINDYAKSYGHKILKTDINAKELSFLKKLDEDGFIQGDKNMINLLKRVE